MRVTDLLADLPSRRLTRREDAGRRRIPLQPDLRTHDTPTGRHARLHHAGRLAPMPFRELPEPPRGRLSGRRRPSA